MLHKETIDIKTIELLKTLQAKTYLKGFHLVGGTALALRIGHRKSIDLDLFSNFSFDEIQMLEKLSSDYNFHLFYSSGNTLIGSIDGIKVDILAHRYKLINQPVIEEGISMLSVQDIIAMKLNAISVSGQRVKDFIDIFFLLKNFKLEEMISFYVEKYTQYSEFNVLRSLIYFEDIDFTEWPVMVIERELTWEEIKDQLETTVKNYLNRKF
jgi:hypothetical protein